MMVNVDKLTIHLSYGRVGLGIVISSEHNFLEL